MEIEQFLTGVNVYGVLAVYAVLFVTIFVESGVFLGFLLPGESLLLTTGILSYKGILGLNIYILMLGYFIAGVLGDIVGYSFGKRFGKRLFSKKDSFLFHKDNLVKAQAFYARHGKKTIIIARFIPIVRSFAPIVAGIGDMHYPTFLIYNIIGALLWGAGFALMGYVLGALIPQGEAYFGIVVGSIVFLSLAPTLMHLARDKESRDGVRRFIRDIVK